MTLEALLPSSSRLLRCAAQSVFAPASNLIFLTWMHLLGGGSLNALMPYIVVSP